MSTKVLLTGATGFIGRHVLDNLLKTKLNIRAIIRNHKKDFFDKKNDLEIITTEDLFSENIDWWLKQCEGIDIVIHIAWYVEPGKYLYSPKNIDCLIGSLNLVKAAIMNGVKRFVGIGTCFEYDFSDGNLSIETPLKPTTPYANAKASLFTFLSNFLPSQSIEFSWCRLFYLYGDGEDERRLVPYIHKHLSRGEAVNLTSGKQIRDFLDVSDAGKIISDIVLSKKQGPINVCSGIPTSVRQLAEKIADEYGRRDLLKFGTRPDNIVDPPIVIGVPNFKKD